MSGNYVDFVFLYKSETLKAVENAYKRKRWIPTNKINGYIGIIVGTLQFK